MKYIIALGVLISLFVYYLTTTKYNNSISNPCYIVGAVTDLDHMSRNPQEFEWHSILQQIQITYNKQSNKYEFKKIKRQKYYSNLSRKNRSMEFSALVKYDDKLYGFCDYTGIGFELLKNNKNAIPRFILQSGNGSISIPFKSEWVTLKDNKIIVGSIGKEWVVNKKEIHQFCEWVKVIDIKDNSVDIEHVNWGEIYMKIRKEMGFWKPGYFLHEAVIWDNEMQKWLFLPRKASKEIYEERVDQHKGTNYLIFVSEDFNDVSYVTVGEIELDWGFSAFVKLDGTKHHYVGIKAKELTDAGEDVLMRDVTNDAVEFKMGSKIAVFNHEGKILSDWFYLGEEKFEGIELLSTNSKCL